MKRLFVWVFIAVAVFIVTARHRHHARASEHREQRRLEWTQTTRASAQPWDAETGTPVRGRVVIAYRDEPTKPGPPPAPSKRPRGSRERSKTAAEPKMETPAVDSKVTPEWFPKNAEEELARAKADSQGYRVFVSGLAGSEVKARDELRQKVDREVSQWLAGDVALGWKPSASMVHRLIKGSFTKLAIEDTAAISKDLDELVTLYRVGARVDFSQGARNEIIGAYNQEIVRERMIKGGAILGFILIVLAALSGYIRADEATKGSYTNRLRILTATGVGAAGVVFYHAAHLICR